MSSKFFLFLYKVFTNKLNSLHAVKHKCKRKVWIYWIKELCCRIVSNCQFTVAMGIPQHACILRTVWLKFLWIVYKQNTNWKIRHDFGLKNAKNMYSFHWISFIVSYLFYFILSYSYRSLWKRRNQNQNSTQTTEHFYGVFFYSFLLPSIALYE